MEEGWSENLRRGRRPRGKAFFLQRWALLGWESGWSSSFSITVKLMSPACLLACPMETCLVLISILQISLWECLRFLMFRGEERVHAMT